MKAFLVLFLLSMLSNNGLLSMTQARETCQEEQCAQSNGKQVYRCESQCDSDMTKIEFNCPKSMDVVTPTSGLRGQTGTMAVADATYNSTEDVTLTPVPTTVPSTNASTEPVVTSTALANTTTGITYVYCVDCPQYCAKCSFNSSTKSTPCHRCATGYKLNAIFQCEQRKSGDKISVAPIVAGAVGGGVAIVVIAVVVVCLIRRKKTSKADVSGQCQLRVVSSDQLSTGKSKGMRQGDSVLSDTDEVDKLPQAPPPPVGYDQLGIAENEQLNYEALDPSASPPNTNPVNQDGVYMNMPNLNANSAKPNKPALSSDKSPKPMTTRSHDSGSNSPQIDNVYTNVNVDSNHPQNSNFPNNPVNGSEASLEMDDIYINENVEEVRRPSASKPKPVLRQVQKQNQEPVPLTQDDIYCNDPIPDPPSDQDQLYEVPEGAIETSRQSDIYINANPDSIYQNMN